MSVIFDWMRRLRFLVFALIAMLASCSEARVEDVSCAKGDIMLDLKQSGSVQTRADEDETLPILDDFIVEIYENSTDRLFFRKTYANTVGKNITLNEGPHRIHAYYGDPKGIGFDACHYVADEEFEVIENALVPVEAVAKLANVKVKVNFGFSLSYDHRDYYAQVITSSGKALTFSKKETRDGYVPAGDLTIALYVHIADKWLCYRSEPVTCEPNDYAVFNVDTRRFGEMSSVTVNIDRETDPVTMEFDVPAEAAPQNAPEITVSGFSEEKLYILEGTSGKYDGYRADIVAMGGIKSCILKMESDWLSSLGFPEEVDLASMDGAMSEKLKAAGLSWLKEMGGKRLSFVDFSGLIGYIEKNGKYHPDTSESFVKISLSVTDDMDKPAGTQEYVIAMDKAEAQLDIQDYNIWASGIFQPQLTVSKGDPSRYVLYCASDMLNRDLVTLEPKTISGNMVTFGDITGLSAGTTYRIWARYNGNQQLQTPILQYATEIAQQVGNRSFEQHTIEKFSFKIVWSSSSGTRVWYQPYASGESDPWWAVNSTATLDNSFTAQYWYYKCFPTVNFTSSSPHSGSRSVIVSSVAINDVGSEILSGDAVTGELYIGKADNSGHECRSITSSTAMTVRSRLR